MYPKSSRDDREDAAWPSDPASAAFDGTAALKSAPALPALDPAERRRSQRCPEQASGWLSNAVGVEQTNGRTVAINDLSLHGVGFTTHKPCRSGDRHWVLITRGPMRLSTRLRIANCRPREDGKGWDVGAEFC